MAENLDFCLDTTGKLYKYFLLHHYTEDMEIKVLVS